MLKGSIELGRIGAMRLKFNLVIKNEAESVVISYNNKDEHIEAKGITNAIHIIG